MFSEIISRWTKGDCHVKEGKKGHNKSLVSLKALEAEAKEHGIKSCTSSQECDRIML